MHKEKGVHWFLGFCFLLLLMGVGLASAGAPAPKPAAAGPHMPEHQIASLGVCQFEHGESVKDCKVSYVTHGKLNENKDNVVLAMQHFMGDHHDVDFLIGPGKALDTDKYFIVATDFLGNSHPREDLTTGPTNSGLKMAFPRYTIRDSVHVEYKLLKEYLGFDRILAAIGASMGAMKAYQLAVSYPTFVQGIIPIAGGPATNPRTQWMMRNMMDIITLDHGWYSGNYETNPRPGVMTALMNFVPWLYGHQWFLTNLKTLEEYHREKKMWHDTWTYDWPQDARDVYYQIQAVVNFTIGDTPGFNRDARAALQSIKAQALIFGAKNDMLNLRDENTFAQQAIPKATLVEIDSPFGHLICCGFDPEATKIMDREIAQFLAKLR